MVDFEADIYICDCISEFKLSWDLDIYDSLSVVYVWQYVFSSSSSKVGDEYDKFLEKMRSEILFLRSEPLKSKMRETLDHFDQSHITHLHCFNMFDAPINRTAVQKTMLLIGLSLALIVIELVVYTHVKNEGVLEGG